ncbi:hypothetical protein M378DRAFT_16999 [Amanita muscaria Koide BX008]|uniref:Uncharacterized protein n=1 Tax=Amanita muscaria (strain Koide BX008) TaxID=946122 RepID=A0A0C2WK48_AMAMK|nr:hypothetical protein M378DRAFT_16999 [Amanita muscaria Koide BX008]
MVSVPKTPCRQTQTLPDAQVLYVSDTEDDCSSQSSFCIRPLRYDEVEETPPGHELRWTADEDEPFDSDGYPTPAQRPSPEVHLTESDIDDIATTATTAIAAARALMAGHVRVAEGQPPVRCELQALVNPGQYSDQGVQTMGTTHVDCGVWTTATTHVDCGVQASTMRELPICSDQAGHTSESAHCVHHKPLSPHPSTVNIAEQSEVQVSKGCSRAEKENCGVHVCVSSKLLDSVEMNTGSLKVSIREVEGNRRNRKTEVFVQHKRRKLEQNYFIDISHGH